MKYNLLENSLDYIFDAVNRLNEDDPDKKSVKYALVHLWSGVELLLKKRLMDEHWSLIFKNIDDKKASKKALITGDFVSVYFNDIVKRLRDFCDIDISDSLEILEKVRKDRNKIEHYQVSASKIQVVSNLIKLWAFILDFSKHIDFSSDSKASTLFEQIRKIMVCHEDFIKHRKAEITSNLRDILKNCKYDKALKCPSCFQKAVPLSLNDKNEITCAFCNTTSNIDDFIFEWQATWNYSGPFDCIECGGLDCVCRTEDGWVCLKCHEEWDSSELDICSSCNMRLVTSPDKEPCCDLCLHSMYD